MQKLKVKGLMLICLMKHPCPGTSVKTTGIAMQSSNMVPARIVDRIKNPHLQRFVAGLPLPKRIVARERHRFHHFQLFESLQKLFP